MCSSPKSQAPSPGETNPERPGGAALKLPKQKPRTLGLCFTAQPRAHLSPPGHVSLAGILVKRRNSLVFPAHRQQPWHIPKGLLVPGGCQRGLSLSPWCQRGSGGRSGAGRCGMGELGTGAAALPCAVTRPGGWPPPHFHPKRCTQASETLPGPCWCLPHHSQQARIQPQQQAAITPTASSTPSRAPPNRGQPAAEQDQSSTQHLISRQPINWCGARRSQGAGPQAGLDGCPPKPPVPNPGDAGVPIVPGGDWREGKAWV